MKMKILCTLFRKFCPESHSDLRAEAFGLDKCENMCINHTAKIQPVCCIQTQVTRWRFLRKKKETLKKYSYVTKY